MGLPSQRSDDDSALVDEIIRSIDGADDPKKVRSLLNAWWRYAGVRAAAGAEVDADKFLAERSSLGLLEMQLPAARAVVELEYAIANGPQGALPVMLAPDLPPVPEPEPEPEIVSEPEPAVEPIPVAVLLADRDLADPPAPAVAAPADASFEDPAWEALAQPVPISHFERFKRDRAERTVESAERARLAVYAGLVVFFALAMGAAMAISLVIGHISVPGGDSEALVAPWRAWLAIVTGIAGVVVATSIARRRGLQRPLFGPRIGLGGLAVTGLGLLCGSLIATGAGGVVLLGGAALGAVRRS